MNNGRVRKSLNTLIRAYKKKNRERNIILQCIVVSVVVVSLVIISLIHGKFQADKLKNQYQDGKTISTFRNCGYINISQSDCPTLDLSWRGNDKVYLIVSDKTFSKLKDVLTVRNLEVQINVKANKEAICKQKLKAWVQEANLKFQSTTGNENQLLYVIKCNSDEIAKQSLYIRTSQIIMYTISGILIFMGLLNYFSTTSTNIIIRQREFSIMRSIGMTQGMLRKMLIYEGIIYVGGVLGLLLIIGSIVMGIVVYILKQNIEYFVFQYPFEGLLCIICIMSFLCVIIPNIFLHKMERNSLIERIKKER